MPTIFSHAAFGAGAARLAQPDDPANARLLTAAGLLAMLPDGDALLMSVIPYAHPLGHRGLTHSLLFAAGIGAAAALWFTRAGWAEGWAWWRLAVLFALVTASHGFFDAMTDGGLGIAFFAPFDNTRYFLPWRPIPVAPLSLGGLATPRGQRLLMWEGALFWTFAAGGALWRNEPKWRVMASIACWLMTLIMWAVALSENG